MGGNNQAVRKLLHVAVSDVNDDVRRAAVTALGFLLFRNPEQCPSVVSLLAESYNPHVRYGAAMALGIACAGTGLKEAVALLEPMMNDPVNYVRQGALLASALVLVQHTEFTSSKVKDIRQLYAKVIADKHEDVMAKFGAILAQGIIDAGGRNVTVSLQDRTHQHAWGGWNVGIYPVLVLVPPLTLPLTRFPAHRHHRTKQGFRYAGNPVQIVGQAEHLRLPRPARGEEEGGQGEGGHRHPLNHKQAEKEGG